MGKGRVRRLTATAHRLGRAYAGDPTAIARLARSAVRKAPKTIRWGLAAALVGMVAVVVLASVFRDRIDAAPVGVRAGTGAEFQATHQLWTAYQIAASVVCIRGQRAWVWYSDEPPPLGDRVDWRLVAAVGLVESGHALGVPVNAFGDLQAPLVGAVSGADTDGGRFDGSGRGDAPVGLVGLTPADVVADGVDGNGDQIVDPNNVWDAAATAGAGALCVRGAAHDPASALLRWRDDTAWGDAVLEAWGDIARRAAAAPGVLPLGAPLAYSPAVWSGGVLAALADRWGAASAVECGAGGCGLHLGVVPDEVDAWAGLLAAGFGAPVAVPGWGVTAAGDPSRSDRIPPWHPTAGLSWPLASVAPPQPDGYDTPSWWSYHLPPSADAWTEPTDGYRVRLPVTTGSMVYAPSSGTAEYHAGGCVRITDADESVWTLCGVRSPGTAGGPPLTGPLQGLLRDWRRIEHASGVTAPTLLVSLGTFACRTVADSDTWSQHSWANAVDIGVDVDGDLQRDPHDMDSATTHDVLTRLTEVLAATMANPHRSILDDASTLIQDQAAQLGRYQIRNLIFNESYQPGAAVSVTRHDEHVHVDFWAGAQRSEPDCSPHEVTAGELLGVASGGTVTVGVTTEAGPLCPQVLFAAWRDGEPLSPADAAEASDDEGDDTETADDAIGDTEPEEGCDG